MKNKNKLNASTKEEENVKEETIIELKGIRKEFPGVVALDNVNMMIKASKVHALVGENGSFSFSADGSR